MVLLNLMAYFSTRESGQSAHPPFYNITSTNNSLNMTPGYLLSQPEIPNDPDSLHHKTQRATVIALMGIFVFITLTLTAAVIVFCKKKNSVFLLQKSDLHADLDLELEDIQTDISDDFGSFTLEITDVRQSFSESSQQDLGQYEALLAKNSTLKQSTSLPVSFDTCQEYQQLQNLPTKSETCEGIKTSYTPLSCQKDCNKELQQDVNNHKCSGNLMCQLCEQTNRITESIKQTDSQTEQMYVFPLKGIISQEDSD
ncbi:uncharacterized protein LOC133193353 [Saccostrea echinata]|uniref:uncharacterized protein LOC133193353 n=1 Tax=Saccostrea echinata TaxID=191078 RepID=UPI002A7F1397|nr:uncharacterized protein LOC133193353 [Saccostrea echinata]